METNTDENNAVCQESAAAAAETDMTRLDRFLEDEKESNRNDSWNKLNNGIKMQKLHIYAEHYAKEHKLPAKEVRALKTFFTESLQKNKLQKTKEVIYDKTSGVVQSVPSLFFNSTARHFTLRNMDKQRVSTLKSLTPKKSLTTAATNET